MIQSILKNKVEKHEILKTDGENKLKRTLITGGKALGYQGKKKRWKSSRITGAGVTLTQAHKAVDFTFVSP